MSDAATTEPHVPPSQRVEPAKGVTENEWLRARREERRQQAPEPVPVPEPDPEMEARTDPDPEPVEEAEAEDVTREDAELLSEAVEPEGEAEPEEDGGVAVPGTVTELAESLGVEPGDLAGHLTVTVNPNGQEQTVTLAELSKGYMREADYTRKTKALAERRNEFEASQTQALERQTASLTRLDQVAMALAQEIDAGYSDAELARISREEPHRYPEAAEQQKRKVAAYNAALQERERVQKEAEQDNRTRAAKYRKEQQDRLAERVPEMRDPEKVKTVEATIRNYLTGEEVGFTNDEVSAFMNGPFDHRSVLVILNAAKAAAQKTVEKKVAKKVKKLPKVSRSGARQSTRQQQGNKVRSARQQLKTEQSVDAGRALLKASRLARRNATHGGSQ